MNNLGVQMGKVMDEDINMFSVQNVLHSCKVIAAKDICLTHKTESILPVRYKEAVKGLMKVV